PAVAVDVRHSNRVWAASAGEVLLGGERASAVAQEHAHRAAGLVRYGEINFAVAVNVRHHQGRIRPGGEVLFGEEGAIAVAQEHACRVAHTVRRGEVELAVAVEVPHRDGARS